MNTPQIRHNTCTIAQVHMYKFATCLAALLALPSFAQDYVAEDPAAVRIEEPAPPGSVSEALLGPDNALDRFVGDAQAWKNESIFSDFSFGAWHWFTVDDILGTGYGSPGLRGTYYWYVNYDPSLEVSWGPVEEIGYHVQTRLRDTGDFFRPFIGGTIWTYENYLYGKGGFGTVKIGEVWRRFGIDWDNTFWGNPGYFDGFKLDTDFGISWEKSTQISDTFAIDSFVQYFLTDNEVNGSLAGGDAESVGGLHEKHGGLIRLVPAWTLPDDSTLALGFTAQVQGFDGEERFGTDSAQWAFAADATWVKGNFSIFSEFSTGQGAAVPARWTSGGPSDEFYAVLAGLAYQTGPIQWRINGSAGWDRNPSGRQLLFNPGATIQLTEHSTLWLEYTNWVIENGAGVETTFSRGLQIAINWNF